jgi:hypothetical protein
MSYQLVGARVMVAPVIVALALGVSGYGSSETAAATAGSVEPAMAPQTVKVAASKASRPGPKAGKVAGKVAAASAAPSSWATPTPRPTMTASAQRFKRGALCLTENQQGRAANGRALTCKKTVTGKLRWRLSRAD